MVKRSKKRNSFRKDRKRNSFRKNKSKKKLSVKNVRRKSRSRKMKGGTNTTSALVGLGALGATAMCAYNYLGEYVCPTPPGVPEPEVPLPKVPEPEVPSQRTTKIKFDPNSLKFKELCENKPRFSKLETRFGKYLQNIKNLEDLKTLPKTSNKDVTPNERIWLKPSQECSMYYKDKPYLTFDMDTNKYCCEEQSETPTLYELYEYTKHILESFDNIEDEYRKKKYKQHEDYILRVKKQIELLLSHYEKNQ